MKVGNVLLGWVYLGVGDGKERGRVGSGVRVCARVYKQLLSLLTFLEYSVAYFYTYVIVWLVYVS